MMKKPCCISILCFLSFTHIYIFALTLESDLNISNFPLKNNGEYRSVPNFGFSIALKEQIFPYFNVQLGFERDAEIGNMLFAKLSYTSSIIDLSLGPSLSMLNSVATLSDAFSSFTPGIFLGIHLNLNSGFIIGFSGSFALDTIHAQKATAFIQSGYFNIGYRFPNLLAELRACHKGKINVVDEEKSFFSISDYGLYTETFYKPSRLKVPINLIFRHIRYDSKKNIEYLKNYGNILFETGFKMVLNTDIEFGLLCGVSVYSFSLGDKEGGISKFFFRSKAHVKFSF